MYKILSLLVLIIFFASSAFAGQTWLTFTTRSGLPSNNILCVAITKGKMAVGTDKGIGYFSRDFSVWLDLGDYAPQLKELAIRSLEFDEEGNLWAATPNGLTMVSMQEFPETMPEIEVFGEDQGLPTIDTEVVQIVDTKIYVGCFGGWIFEAVLAPKGSGMIFRPSNLRGGDQADTHRIVSVGITGLAMDFPGGGLYSTKGKGLLRGVDGSDYVNNDALPTDWVNDFWCFQTGNSDKVIALCQQRFSLISDRNQIVAATLPNKSSWISCVTTAPDEEREVLTDIKEPEYRILNEFLGERVLYLGTKDRGLWKFDEGRWENLTVDVCPLPSNCINKIYYIPSAKKVAVCTDSGLTMFGTDEDYAYDEFEFMGSTPFFAKSFWPFMTLWGPRIYGYPYQKSYPIEPFIPYFKLLRGKDMWVSHGQGLSRYVFPTQPFLGAMANHYTMAGRFENPKNFPDNSILVEDNSVVNQRPLSNEGESTWHHYCKEQPNDFNFYPLGEVFTSDDMKTICGPLNMVHLSVNNVSDIGQAHQEALNASYSLQYPPVFVFEDENGSLYDDRGKILRSVADRSFQIPLHSILSTEIGDFDLDLNERVWIVFEKNGISVLDPTSQYLGGLVYGRDRAGEWHHTDSSQLPWSRDEEVLCIKRIGADLYVGTRESGVFILPAAHTKNVAELNWQDWQQLKITDEASGLDESYEVRAIEFWENDEGKFSVFMHEEGLSLFDGKQLVKIAVPKRSYTCIKADRTGRLWAGSLQGLLYIEPNFQIVERLNSKTFLDSDRVTHIAAAPDDAKYPWIIAVACDKQYSPDKAGFISSDVPPFLTHPDDNPYILKVKNPSIQGSSVALYDGKQWERLSRPGVHHMMFDQKFLWLATSCRIMRLYMPVEVTSY
jgi:ligand-binding sensor domain-containing protein